MALLDQTHVHHVMAVTGGYSWRWDKNQSSHCSPCPSRLLRPPSFQAALSTPTSQPITSSPPLPLQALLLVFNHLVLSDSLQPHGLKHTRLPCPSPTLRTCSNSCPSNRLCHPTISSSVVPFSSCPQSFPASGSSPMSRLFSFRPKEANSPIPTPPSSPGACIIPLCSS